MVFSCHSKVDFKAAEPLRKTIFFGGIITMVALAAIGAASLWISTGSLFPFASLGVPGTIGLASLLGIVAIGTVLLLAAIIIICLKSIIKNRNSLEKENIKASRQLHDAEKKRKDALAELAEADTFVGQITSRQ